VFADGVRGSQLDDAVSMKARFEQDYIAARTQYATHTLSVFLVSDRASLGWAILNATPLK
jgi:hypothetical protein